MSHSGGGPHPTRRPSSEPVHTGTPKPRAQRRRGRRRATSPVTVHLLASPVGTARTRYGEKGISSPPYLMRMV